MLGRAEVKAAFLCLLVLLAADWSNGEDGTQVEKVVIVMMVVRRSPDKSNDDSAGTDRVAQSPTENSTDAGCVRSFDKSTCDDGGTDA